MLAFSEAWPAFSSATTSTAVCVSMVLSPPRCYDGTSRRQIVETIPCNLPILPSVFPDLAVCPIIPRNPRALWLAACFSSPYSYPSLSFPLMAHPLFLSKKLVCLLVGRSLACPRLFAEWSLLVDVVATAARRRLAGLVCLP